ncbi:hypothetical protein Zmor_025257 [Zophobas morio]|uniref:UDP-glucuronosyltransferase n=1 Tax=Zophobas morio TaxID=2755281 RepID=A0AA38M4S0_9CUCU|nr:hypothetical protein Zmor_025257 [Zophobas morio]
MKTQITLFVFAATLCAVQSARILGIFPLPGKSHYILGSSLMRALAEHGHDVTVINPFGEKNPPKGKYRDILLPEIIESIENRKDEFNMFEIGDLGPFVNIPILAYLMSDIGEMVLKEKTVQELIHSNEKFDLVIIEQFYNDAHKMLATHFGGIQIVFSTVGANFWVNSIVGNPSPLAYIPDVFLSYSPHMTFGERLVNTLCYLLNVAVHGLYLYPKHNSVGAKYIPNAPSIHDINYNASLVLLNSHPSLNQPVPHVPNMIEIGGFHIKPPKKLPQDLQEFLDGAKDGVIYFSMGSNLRSADLPLQKRNGILKTFAKLKEKVLWKWEEDELPGRPENVKLGKWLPQQDILAHPNVKLFITHGGLLSTTETVYFGVPVLAIPVYGDQKLNAQTAVSNGFGLVLPYKELNERTLREKLDELLNNPKYGDNAKSRSRIFHDRQVKPVDTALYWVDYVIRHKGAPHLRVAALDLPWYKYLLIDVIAFVAGLLLMGVYLVRLLLRKLCGRVSSKKLKKN